MSRGTLTRILHVDDDRDIRELVRLSLERNGGYQVESCANAKEALARAPAFGPDLIILDVIMPDQDGLELYEAIKRLDGVDDVPVIFMTSAAQTVDMRAYARSGALGTILKPFDFQTLAETVQAVWDGGEG